MHCNHTNYISRVALFALLLLLAACNGGGGGGNSSTSSNTPGTLIEISSTPLVSRNASSFWNELNTSQNFLAPMLAAYGKQPGNPMPCGVDSYHIAYVSVGGAKEVTQASGAVMVPTGTAPDCNGARPILLYAHGTAIDRNFNIADYINNGEGNLIAAMFAAQGYIVVAPNYAGYDTSTLAYHPYLNASQQSQDMIYMLTAARTALMRLPISTPMDSGQLFITGYSQGGYVAMATQQALEAAGQPVTATAPMSGPYAMNAMADKIFYGDVILESTLFAPLISTSYQKAYGNIYTTPADIYTANYATDIETLLPSTTPDTLFSSGKLPGTALFNSAPNTTLYPVLANYTPPAITDPLAALGGGFGNPYLITDSARATYLTDARANVDHGVPGMGGGASGVDLPNSTPKVGLRAAAVKNDMRNWKTGPRAPMLLCGGNADPMVFWFNASVMQTFWRNTPAAGQVSMILDVDQRTPTAAAPYDSLQTSFSATKSDFAARYGNAGLINAYHGWLVPPYCTTAALLFFRTYSNL